MRNEEDFGVVLVERRERTCRACEAIVYGQRLAVFQLKLMNFDFPTGSTRISYRSRLCRERLKGCRPEIPIADQHEVMQYAIGSIIFCVTEPRDLRGIDRKEKNDAVDRSLLLRTAPFEKKTNRVPLTSNIRRGKESNRVAVFSILTKTNVIRQ